MGIIFLLIEPYNKNRFVRFHAFQSISLRGIIAFEIVWYILAGILVHPASAFSVSSDWSEC